MNWPKRAGASCATQKGSEGEGGFTLAETAVAFLIMMIVLLGVASVFAYSVYNNASGADRSQTLAVAQQTLETIRNARFSTLVTDEILEAGTDTQEDVLRGGPNGQGARPYTIVSQVEDTTPTLKTITVSVTPTGAGPAWATGTAASVTVVTQRSRSHKP